jgi:hypothetical protein
MLFHQLGKNFVLGLQFGLKLADAFLLGFFLTAMVLFENGCPVLEKLFLPPIKKRRLQVVLVAQIRDRNLVNQVAFENENFFLTRVFFFVFCAW